LKRFKRT